MKKEKKKKKKERKRKEVIFRAVSPKGLANQLSQILYLPAAGW